VFPPAGRTPRYDGEWAGPWEKYVVQAVVPWVDTHLPSIPSRRARTLAGLSAGGYGAVDIGLRHPTVFGTLESWSGYFRAPRDGPLRFASETELEAHDPTLLAWSKAPALRSLATRFFLSCGTTADRDDAALAESFAGVLTSLRLPHELWLAPGGHDGKFWRRQLPAALRYAFPREL
jgi:enterochelin esterase-like enzyme